MARAVNPDSLAPPRGYSNGILLPMGEMLFVAGQIGWDAKCKLVGDDISSQFAQAMQNVLDVVVAANGHPEHIGRLTIYVTDKRAYLNATKTIGGAYRRMMGGHYPAMSLVEVADLLEEGALVEIEATAVIPPREVHPVASRIDGESR